MKTIFPCFLVSIVATCSFAQGTTTNAPATTSTNKTARPIATLQVSAGEGKAPFIATNGILSQPEQTDLEGSGKAVCSFTLAEAGSYIFKAVVDAPGEDQNSFFVNVDASPTDPEMIWDI